LIGKNIKSDSIIVDPESSSSSSTIDGENSDYIVNWDGEKISKENPWYDEQLF
jgi:hypothetical protein